MLIAIVSDTHMPRSRRRLPAGCVERIEAADLILHGGDVMTAPALAELERIGRPLLAVQGNVDDDDLRLELPAERIVEAGGAQIAMVHDAGPSRGRLARLRRRFPEADAVVFGHSHIPLHESDGDFQIFNPGSPTERRRAPTHTMGMLQADSGRLTFTLIHLD
ncbi:MAG: metallophosphatase family protein [Actinomycetota bacterium]|nr:metallophosphatase family protein [Actinomycetota bacterium]